MSHSALLYRKDIYICIYGIVHFRLLKFLRGDFWRILKITHEMMRSTYILKSDCKMTDKPDVIKVQIYFCTSLSRKELNIVLIEKFGSVNWMT